MNKDSGVGGVLVSVLYFVLGVVLIAATNELLITFNYILVSICAVIGVIQVIGFFINKKYKSNNYSDLLIAVVFIWVSLVLYVYYGFMINILPILFSLYLFVMAIDMISKYINIRNKKYVILAVISFVVGLLLIFNPGSVILIYLKITGVYLVVVSVLSFMDCFSKNKSDV